METGPEGEDVGECYLFPMDDLVCFLILPKTTCSGMALLQVSWVHPNQSLLRKYTTELTTGKFYGEVFSTKSLSSQITLACVKLI